MIQLKTVDEKTISISRSIAQLSGVINDILDATQAIQGESEKGESEKEEEIPLTNEYCTHNIVTKAVEFLEKQLEKQNTSEEIEENGIKPDWVFAFFNELEDFELIGIIHVANYLDLPILLDNGTERLAGIIKSCATPEKVMNRFNVSM